MLLGRLDLTESANLEFGLEVQGTEDNPSQVRFVIEGPDYGLVCRCEDMDGTLHVQIPKLKGIIPSGIYECRLEVIIDGKIFTPLKESIEFNPVVEFNVKPPVAKAAPQEVKVKPVGFTVTQKKPAAEPVVEDTASEVVKNLDVEIETDENGEDEVVDAVEKPVAEAVQYPPAFAPDLFKPVKITSEAKKAKANALLKKLTEAEKKLSTIKAKKS